MRQITTNKLTRISLGAVLIIICSWISIPMTIPFTLQTFAVFFLLLFLGGKQGTISICVYLLLGVVGIPVFSGFQGGFGTILGPTGGYLLGFIVMGCIYWILEKYAIRKFSKIILLSFGLFICYIFGTLWILYASNLQIGSHQLGSILMVFVVPYIVPDYIKMMIAFWLNQRLRKANVLKS